MPIPKSQLSIRIYQIIVSYLQLLEWSHPTWLLCPTTVINNQASLRNVLNLLLLKSKDYGALFEFKITVHVPPYSFLFAAVKTLFGIVILLDQNFYSAINFWPAYSDGFWYFLHCNHHTDVVNKESHISFHKSWWL